jgi:hypothetical protein
MIDLVYTGGPDLELSLFLNHRTTSRVVADGALST